MPNTIKILKHASFILAYEQEKAQPLGNKKENEQYLQDAYNEVRQIKNNSTLKQYYMFTVCVLLYPIIQNQMS